jgi:hypothetical protein
MKTIIFSLILIFAATNASIANQPIGSLPSQSIQVAENEQHTVTVSWNEDEFETIEIGLDGNMFVPTMPTSGAKEIHLNSLEDGVYVINFRNGGEIVASKTVTIANHSILASNE